MKEVRAGVKLTLKVVFRSQSPPSVSLLISSPERYVRTYIPQYGHSTGTGTEREHERSSTHDNTYAPSSSNGRVASSNGNKSHSRLPNGNISGSVDDGAGETRRTNASGVTASGLRNSPTSNASHSTQQSIAAAASRNTNPSGSVRPNEEKSCWFCFAVSNKG